MDYLQAITPTGFLHASSCDWGDGDGERFRACMEAQGFTVTRYTAEEARTLRPPPGSHEVQEIGPELKQCVDLNEALRLPEPGQEVITPRLGRGVVVTHLTLQGGERVALVRGPRGEGMARAGHWEAVPVEPSPVKEEAAPVPLPELPAVPVPPGQWVMPSLFEGLTP
ncbi:hypothetical protein [Deinococcus sp. NW-56]|uniref:hypothetical protein n=1 Tax=Deinococcus sp. NW-56 TaxID=2080419 RepID=UPI000CF453E0|nr:hypothetical protein [Deinococcus sp. NW-56]